MPRTQASKLRYARKMRKYVKKIRKYQSKAIVKRRKVPLALKPHNFCERHTATESLGIGTDASPGTGLQKSFNIGQIRNSSSYMDLFEYYKIDKVVVKFRYKGPGTQAYSNTTDVVLHNEQNPILYFKVDHNDVDADGLGVMKDSMKTKAHVFTNNNSEFTITLKPAVQTEAYKSALATTYMPKWQQWLSTEDTTVPHYGLKAYCIGPNNTQSNGALDIEYITYFSVKNNE